MFLIILLYMLMASTFTLGKAALVYVQPVFFIGMRMTLAGLLLLGYVWVRQGAQQFFSMWRYHWRLIVQIILLHIYLTYVCEFVALKYVTSWKASLLYNLSPFVTALLSYHFLRERFSARKWVGLLIGSAGFIPVLVATTPQEGATFGGISGPEILLLISVVASAQGWIVMKQLVVAGYTPVAINGMGMLGGGLLAFLSSLLLDSRPLIVASSGTAHTWTVLFLYTGALILIANVIFYNLYGALLKKYSATLLSFAGFTCPLFTAFYGWVLLGEQVQGWFFLSVLMIFGGLYLFYRDELGTV